MNDPPVTPSHARRFGIDRPHTNARENTHNHNVERRWEDDDGWDDETKDAIGFGCVFKAWCQDDVE